MAMKGAKRSICVYCASSQRCAPVYHAAARRVGEILADEGYSIVYGGGRAGSMGALADGALSRGGTVIGILPKFMMELEWGHPKLTELRIVEDMRVRKHSMLSQSCGLVTLPGGTGTFEELFEALSLKRLGLYTHPIVLLNTNNYFDALIALLEKAVAEHFLDERHLAMWQVVNEPEEIPKALHTAPPWSERAREFAAIR
ncbi:MAG TPA: TIGR00730 family Rossman fold protein [Sandaracinaceae bacterium]